MRIDANKAVWVTGNLDIAFAVVRRDEFGRLQGAMKAMAGATVDSSSADNTASTPVACAAYAPFAFG